MDLNLNKQRMMFLVMVSTIILGILMDILI